VSQINTAAPDYSPAVAQDGDAEELAGVAV
jgi:hypothetical protein